MINTRFRLAMASACLLAFVAAGCSSDGGSTTTNAPAGSGAVAAPVALTIENSTFSAASVAAGTAFTISNNDSRTHTVTDDAGSFDQQVDGGSDAQLTIPTAGTYQIHCKIHSSMHGTITVT
jgi:plastocyanin